MKKQESTLMNFMGARLSKSGERVNLTLIKGEGEAREYRNVSMTLDTKAKTKCKAKITEANGQYYAVIAIPFFDEDNDRLIDEEAEAEAEEQPVKKVVKKAAKKVVKQVDPVDTSDSPF